jgi:hypothetical protein
MPSQDAGEVGGRGDAGNVIRGGTLHPGGGGDEAGRRSDFWQERLRKGLRGSAIDGLGVSFPRRVDVSDMTSISAGDLGKVSKRVLATSSTCSRAAGIKYNYNASSGR